MVAKTRNTYISESVKDSIEMPTANLRFSTIQSSKKVPASDCKNDRQPEMAREAPKKSIMSFPVVDHVIIARGQCLRARRGRKPKICPWNFVVYVMVPEIQKFPVLTTSLPFPVIGHCCNHLATLILRWPWSKIPDPRFAVGILILSLRVSDDEYFRFRQPFLVVDHYCKFGIASTYFLRACHCQIS